jgi:hypothetical protein
LSEKAMDNKNTEDNKNIEEKLPDIIIKKEKNTKKIKEKKKLLKELKKLEKKINKNIPINNDNNTKDDNIEIIDIFNPQIETPIINIPIIEKEKMIIDSEINDKKKKQLLLLKMLANKNKNIRITNENNVLSSNDYIIELTDKVEINNINLLSVDIPKNEENNITDTNNQLVIIYNNEKKIIELEPNYYNRYEIVECMNNAFDSENLPIKCILDDNDKFIFKSINEIFEMHNDENSILPTLGFSNVSYINKRNYVNNNLYLYDNIFYLSIHNLDPEPIFKINNDTNEIIKLKNINNIKNTDFLIIKFYHSPNILVKNKCNFFFQEHILELEII